MTSFASSAQTTQTLWKPARNLPPCGENPATSPGRSPISGNYSPTSNGSCGPATPRSWPPARTSPSCPAGDPLTLCFAEEVSDCADWQIASPEHPCRISPRQQADPSPASTRTDAREDLRYDNADPPWSPVRHVRAGGRHDLCLADLSAARRHGAVLCGVSHSAGRAGGAIQAGSSNVMRSTSRSATYAARRQRPSATEKQFWIADVMKGANRYPLRRLHAHVCKRPPARGVTRVAWWLAYPHRPVHLPVRFSRPARADGLHCLSASQGCDGTRPVRPGKVTPVSASEACQRRSASCFIVGCLGVADLAGGAPALAEPTGPVVVAAVGGRVGGGTQHRHRAVCGGLGGEPGGQPHHPGE